MITTEHLLILILAGAVGLLLIFLIILLASRSRNRPGADAVFTAISRRLDELSRLQERFGTFEGIFRAPQIRGWLGEALLEDLLARVLPRGSYRFQHRFADGVQVDALVKIGPRYLPIDAKFPLDAVRSMWEEGGPSDRLPSELKRKLKQQIGEIAKKYIQPKEHTFPFALMYIPSEAVFYEGFIRDARGEDLFGLALDKRVIPVGPSGLYLYLETLLYAMKSYEVNRNIDRLLVNLQQLTGDLARFGSGFATARSHLKNLHRAFDDAARDLERVEATAARLSGGGTLHEMNADATED
ncbi:MAG TPA: DNA recombination protein RmuC [Spirochaetia bacterium]|nr:DNA recombination protein RmuC [Spirochaetia bacterium]